MLKALIVEDEVPILNALKEFFTQKQFQVVALAENANQALRMLKKNPCDVVITDIKMPGMDGLELMRICSESFPEIKFIVVTGNESFDYAKTALNYGALAFVSKFKLFEDLNDAVKRTFNYFNISAHENEKNIDLLMEKARKYIDKHIHQKLTVKDIASYFYLSTAYFSKQFSKKFGTSCTDYITEKKMELAKRLLETLTVNEVAEQLGYMEPKNFRKAFFSRFGVSPSSFRRNQ